MFHYDEQWRDWANAHVSRTEYDRAVAFELRHGQHAVLRVRQDDGFTRIDLDPLEDFKWLVPLWKRQEYKDGNHMQLD